MILRKGRTERFAYAAATERGGEAENDTEKENDGHDDLRPGGGAALQADKRAHHKRNDRQKKLAHINVEAGDLIVEAELEGRAEQRSRDQRERRCIRPDDRDIGEQQKPCAQKAVVIAEAFFRIGVCSAGVGEAVHQIVIVCADQDHNKSAERNAQSGPDRAGDRKESAAGHDKRAPANAAAKRKSPCAERGEIRRSAAPGR